MKRGRILVLSCLSVKLEAQDLMGDEDVCLSGNSFHMPFSKDSDLCLKLQLSHKS